MRADRLVNELIHHRLSGGASSRRLSLSVCVCVPDVTVCLPHTRSFPQTDFIRRCTERAPSNFSRLLNIQLHKATILCGDEGNTETSEGKRKRLLSSLVFKFYILRQLFLLNVVSYNLTRN